MSNIEEALENFYNTPQTLGGVFLFNHIKLHLKTKIPFYIRWELIITISFINLYTIQTHHDPSSQDNQTLCINLLFNYIL